MNRIALVSVAHLTAWAASFPTIPSGAPNACFWLYIADVMGIPLDAEELRTTLERLRGQCVVRMAPSCDGVYLRIGDERIVRRDVEKPFVLKERRAYAHEQLPLLLAG